MSTNPNNAIGTNGAYGGRTSVNAFNDLANAFTRGIISGWACSPDSGLTVSLGGDGTTRDVAIAVDNAGNRTTINNISGSPVNVTLSSAPASNSRIDLIVAYVDNPPQGDSSTADNPGACGIIPVTGTASASPLPPSENTIRTAITSDGASGTTAYYVVLAQITITSGTTDITSNNITQNTVSTINTANVGYPTTYYGAVSSSINIGQGSSGFVSVIQLNGIPAGSYYCVAQAQVRGNIRNDGLSGNARIVDENTGTYLGNFGSTTYSTNGAVNRCPVFVSGVLNLASAGTISLKCTGVEGSSFFVDSNTTLFLVKIG